MDKTVKTIKYTANIRQIDRIIAAKSFLSQILNSKSNLISDQLLYMCETYCG